MEGVVAAVFRHNAKPRSLWLKLRGLKVRHSAIERLAAGKPLSLLGDFVFKTARRALSSGLAKVRRLKKAPSAISEL